MAPETSRAQSEVGLLARQLRISQQMTLAGLASAADVDNKTLRTFERGETWPQDVTRSKIENALGLRTGSLDRAVRAIEKGAEVELRPADGVRAESQKLAWRRYEGAATPRWDRLNTLDARLKQLPVAGLMYVSDVVDRILEDHRNELNRRN